MKECLFLLYQLATVGLPGLAFLWYLRKVRKIKADGLSWCFLAIYMLYIAAVIDVTGAGALPDGLRRGVSLNWFSINLLPFSRDIDWMGYWLNVLLMAPLGFLLPILGRGYNMLRVTGAGLLFSLMIELSQLLNMRSTDVDDLICNTLGAAVGYLGFLLVSRVLKWKPRGDLKPFLMLLCVFGGRFILYDGLGVAGLIYGF